MSWFHKERGGKITPILKHVRHTTFLGAEIADGQLSRLCYTGHANGLSDRAVVHAIIPGDHMLWSTDLAEEDDVGEGHVACAKNVVVTRVRHGKGHEVIGHDLWTGEERWRVPVARMVTRMGISGDTLSFVTFDHAVHKLSIATGEPHKHDPVMTDQAASRIINATQHPIRDFSRGSARTSQDDWSDIYSVAPRLEVYERDWAGTDEFGIGYGGDVHLIGSGSYEGALTVGDVCILSFKLDIDGTTHHHWYFYGASSSQQLAVLREDGKSELFKSGTSYWQGKL